MISVVFRIGLIARERTFERGFKGGFPRFSLNIAKAFATHPEIDFSYSFGYTAEVHEHLLSNQELLFQYLPRAPVKTQVTEKDYLYTPFPEGCFRSHTLSCKQVMTLHDISPLIFPEYYFPELVFEFRKILKRGLDLPFFFSVSQFTKEAFCEYFEYPLERVIVTPLAAEGFYPSSEGVDALIQKYALPYKKYFFSLSPFADHKNVQGVLRSFREFLKREKEPEIGLILAGCSRCLDDTEALECFRLLSDPLLKKHTILLETLEEDELRTFYSGAIAFLFPSFAEGFGLPPLEAMACGAPVISSNTCSLPEVLGEKAILLSPSDTKTWVNEMQKICKDVVYRESLKQYSLQRAGQFSWDRTVNIMVDELKKRY
tara:strand:+ start:942 stop:2060 length:1119 start_codon:yes stop_codon:yes gene_type:complete